MGIVYHGPGGIVKENRGPPAVFQNGHVSVLAKDSGKIDRIFMRKFVDFFKEKRIIMSCMDTLIKRGSAGSDVLAELSDHQFIVGTKQLKKALNRGGVLRVFLARDADPAILEPLELLCRRSGTEYTWVERMTDLGRACGIDVGATAAATIADL